jgi:hypothetical protein
MSGIPTDLWKQLELSRPSGDELIGRQAYPEAPRLLAAVDSRGRRHLLVALEAEEPALVDAGSRGLSVLTEELVLPGNERSRYINVTCDGASGYPMLDIIGGEVAERLHALAEGPAEIVSRVLGKWRRFWGQLPSQLLTREAQIGLFAEIWFLTYWLLPALGLPGAVHAWRGPYGARHDFEHLDSSIEVKAATSTRGRIFKINGLQQLEPPQSGILLFFGMRLREEVGAGNTLPMLVSACRHQVSIDPDAEGLLETGLISAGYLSAHANEYEKVHWRVVEELLFDVRDDFPRVVSKSFPNGPAHGVEEIEYSINLSTFDHLIAARKPGDGFAIIAPRRK